MYHSRTKTIQFLKLLLFNFFLLIGSFGYSQTDITCDGSSIDLNFNGSYQDYTVPMSPTKDYIYIKLDGGDGGKASVFTSVVGKGGDGATAIATFPIGSGQDSIAPGSTLRFIIGDSGKNRSSGTQNSGTGGGGSGVFIQHPDSTSWQILMVAGGGGGGWANTVQSSDGRGGRAGTSGGDGKNQDSNGGNGGSNGQGGKSSGNSGGGGGIYDKGGSFLTSDGESGGEPGWQQVSDGNDPNFTIDPEGGEGGCNNEGCTAGNGFGVGGGGGSKEDAGGGGGGYSGGGGGGNAAGGGGGGSFINSDFAVLEMINDGGVVGTPDKGKAVYQCINKPVAACVSSLTKKIGTEGEIVLTTNEIDNGSSSEQTLTYELDDNIIDCDDIGTKTVTLTITDEAGFTATCTTSITVNDEAEDFSTMSLDSETTIDADGDYEDIVIPSTTTATSIFIEAVGGDGGRKGNPCGQTGRGGKGAKISALFKVGTGTNEIPPGSILRFIAGEEGASKNSSGIEGAGGGGGSAVLFREDEGCDWTLLIVAGGGGGGYSDGCTSKSNGRGGSTNESGSDGRGGSPGNGANNGNGGGTGSNSGIDFSGGGGGANERGGNINCSGGNNFGGGEKGGTLGGDGGGDGPSGCGGGRDGGYGFGGGGLGDGAGGGGGGYSGGGGGGTSGGGGGGGSYLADDYIFDTSTPIKEGGGDTGSPDDGYITFRLRESIPPVAVCNATLTKTVTFETGVSISPSDLNNGSSDEDGSIVSTSIDIDYFDCDDIGEHTVTLTVTDDDGLSDDCTTLVTIKYAAASGVSDLNDNGSEHTINANGTYTDLIVPENTTYSQIKLMARGGDGGRRRVNAGIYDCTAKGGQGADIEGTFTIGCGTNEIPPGSVIRFVPGKAGASNTGGSTVGAGGGGGSGILYKEPGACDWTLLVVAGGGGGAYASGVCQTSNGKEAEKNQGGSGGKGNGSGSGGNNGNGGNRGGNNFAAGGGGANSNGENINCSGGSNFGGGKQGGSNGGDGGADGSGPCPSGRNGGFGYGGGGLGLNAGGGGGGYSGGGSGGTSGGGGGGGSFIASYATNISEEKRGTDGSPDDGFCRYQFLSNSGSAIDGAPTASCSNTTVTLNDDGEAVLFPSTVASGSSDDCTASGDLVFSFSGGVGSITYDCDNSGSGNSVTVTVEDLNGNTSTCTATITVQESTDPEAVCQDATVAIDNSGTGTLVPADLDGGSTDNCGISTYAASQTNFTSSDIGSTTVTLTVTDGAGNTDNCTATVTVELDVTVNAVCQDITRNLDAMGQVSITTSDIDNGSTADGFIASLALSQTDFDCDDVGNNTVTLVVTDTEGGSANCTATVTINDNTAPTALCTDTNVNLDATGNGTLNPANIDGGSTDNCTNLSLSASKTAFSCDDSTEPTIVTLTVTDNAGNSSTCTASVTVDGSVNPTAVCQTTVVQLNEMGQGTITTADIDGGSFDPCGSIVNTTIDQNIFNCEDLGNGTMVTLTVTDNEGNSSSCSTNITVEDNLAPTAICNPQAVVLLDENGIGLLTENDADGGSFDNCGTNLSLSLDRTAFTCEDTGEPIVVQMTVEDDFDNISTCEIVVSVEDLTAPTAMCNDLTVVLDNNGNGSITTDEINNGSTDNCGIETIELDQMTFDCSDAGNNVTVTLTVTDVNDNPATCTSTISVVDDIAPTALCKDKTVQLNSSGNGSITTANINNGSSDACTPLTFSLSQSDFDCSDVGTVNVTLTVTDNSGNSSTCNAVVTVEDNFGPSAACTDFTVQLDADGNGSVTADDIDSGSSDACGIASLSIPTLNYNCSDVGQSEIITLTVTDVNGNVNSCPSVIMIQDNVAPVALCQDVTVQLNANGNASITAAQVDNGSNDACGIASLSLNQTSFDCNEVADNTVTLTVTDVNGNTSSCTSTITIEDNTPPTALCINPTLSLNDMGTLTISPLNVDNGSYDNCDIESLAIDNKNFNCSNVGNNNTVILTVTDVNGNVSTCTSTITIEDSTNPIANCQDLTVQLDDNGSASITPQQVDNVSWDACGIASLSLDHTSFDCSQQGGNTVTLTVVDNNGNSNTCTANITVEDVIKPSANCNNPTVFLDNNGEYLLQETDVYAGGSDNCGTVNFQSMDITSVDCSAAGNVVAVVVTINDGNGNTAECTAQVSVIDDIEPIAECLNRNIDFNGEASIEVDINTLFDDVNSFDNCDVINIISSNPIIDCGDVGNTLTFEVAVEDASGNPASCFANVTVGGLPCNWRDNGGIGCNDNLNSSSYDAVQETFSITANSCIPAFPYTSDQAAFVFQELCGDGQIEAYVESVSGNGYAGIMMRDSEDPGATMVALGTNRVNRIQRQVRVLPNYPAYPQSLLSYDKYWLRIVRTGAQFKAFASVDGVQWIPYVFQYINMSDCITVGMYVHSDKVNEPVTGVFSNVTVGAPSVSLSAPNNTIAETNATSIISDVGLFPNPTTNDINLEVEDYLGQNLEVKVFDSFGRVIHQDTWIENDLSIRTIDVSNHPAGTYFISIQTNQGMISKRFIITRP